MKSGGAGLAIRRGARLYLREGNALERSDYLQLVRTTDEDSDREWTIAFDVSHAELDNAEAASRRSLTPEQAHAQVSGGHNGG